MNDIILNLTMILSVTLMYSTPLIFASLGGVMSENSGVVNIGLEGMMTFGAFSAAAAAYLLGDPWLGFLFGALGGALFGLLHAIATVKFGADHIVSGIAINLLAPGLAVFMCRVLFNGSNDTPPISHKIPHLFKGVFEKNSALDNLFNQSALTYLVFLIVIIIWFLLFKTKLGLRIRSVGEHPQAADTLGINVNGIKFFCVIMSGMLAGLGGASLSIDIVSSFRPTLVSGHGFIALAALIFGKWKPQGALLASLFFGLCTGLVIFLGKPSIGLHISENLLSLLPYVSTIVVLIFIGKKSNGPSANGKPYIKGEK